MWIAARYIRFEFWNIEIRNTGEGVVFRPIFMLKKWKKKNWFISFTSKENRSVTYNNKNEEKKTIDVLAHQVASRWQIAFF